jgi:DNA replication protein DnaC
LSALKAERLAYLSEQGLAADFDQVALTCPVCRDSGQVDGRPCSCYRALLIPLLMEQANLAHLRGMTWADFNLSLFDDQSEPNRYQSDLSPRQQMIGLKKAAERFVSRFDQPDERSMLYIGKPGTGKTYLMACTAHALLQQGRPVLYLTAPQLFDRLQENRILLSSYNPDPERLERSSAMKDAILNSDLLLIDDLGTEAGAASRYADLLGVIDGRMAASRKMIISTNADPATLRDQYDERLLSRLVGSFAVYRFFGEDIRLQISRRRRA